MKKHTKFMAVIILSMSMLVFSPLFSWSGAQADVQCSSSAGGLSQTSSGLCLPQSAQTGLATGGINNVLLTVINGLLAVATTVAILYIIWGGFQYITSAGNSEKAESGQRTLVNALIGLCIIILAFVIVGIINATVSDCLSKSIILGCI